MIQRVRRDSAGAGAEPAASLASRASRISTTLVAFLSHWTRSTRPHGAAGAEILDTRPPTGLMGLFKWHAQ